MSNIRTAGVPQCLILFTNSGTIPPNWTHECTLASKYLKGVCSSDPGCNVGSNTHSDPVCTNTHSHPTSTSGSHNHSLPVGPATLSGSYCASDPLTFAPDHTGSFNSGPQGSIPSSITCGPGSHSHPSTSHEPQYRTLHPIKYTPTAVSLRQKDAPTDAKYLFTKSLACIPTGFSIVNSGINDGRYIKGTAASCSCIATGGSTTHTHGNDGAHTHTVNVGPHTHPIPASFSHPGPLSAHAPGAGGPQQWVSDWTHSHPTGSYTVGASPACSSACSPSGGSHGHGTANNDPSHVEIGFIEQNGYSLRRPGVPSLAIGVWTGTLASIPGGFVNSDGTNCTVDMRNRIAKTIPCVCTNPGTLCGSATHTHCAAGHTHCNTTVGHTHPFSGRSGPGSGSGGAPSGSGSARKGHTHSAGGPASPNNVSIAINSGGCHTHPSTSNDPASTTVAFIQKV